jgi:hypothetical protein
MFLRTLMIVAAAGLALAACSKRIQPPGQAGVCYHVVPQPDGSLKYNVLAKDQPSLEHCAAKLEVMRLSFLRMGGSARELMGAYQSNFLYVQRQGIFTATSLEGNRYLVLVRSGDGRLVMPGAMPR